MAAKKASKPKKSLPKGYKELTQRLDGFFERTEGNSIEALTRGDFAVNGKFGRKRVFRLEVVEGETQVGDGEMVGLGAIVGLDETGYTKKLADLEPGSRVFVRYDGKDGEGQQDAHVFTIAVPE
jgi:hypothetical protein